MNTDVMIEAFFEEVAELLADFETDLLRLEESPNDKDLLNRIFRCAHTVKGNGSMVGLDNVAQFAHALENLLERLRDGTLTVNSAVANTLLGSVDVLKALIVEAKGGKADQTGQRDKVYRAIRAIVDGGSTTEPTLPDPQGLALQPAAGEQILYEIHFVPPTDLLHRGLDPLECLQALSGHGQFVQVSAETGGVPNLEALDLEKCYLRWKIWLLSGSPEREIRACFDLISQPNAVTIEALKDEEKGGTVKTAAEDSTRQSTEQPTAKNESSAVGLPTESGSIRVSTDKVDKLINLVGEIVIAQSMINQVVRDFAPSHLHRLQEAITDMDRNTRELQERVMAVRMLPIGNVFNRCPRLVRDLAATLNKKVKVEILGEDTELDKEMIERIGDPLTHLMRNAVDHGMETPEERKQAGKHEQGIIRMHAFHQGGSVIIDVSDDGRGLNAELIRAKAISLGWIGAEENLSEEQLHALIFRPGFSTAASVSGVSGRGVGLDVVKKHVESLNGSVTLSSEPGRGTHFRIKLPLTLAILDGLSLQVGQEIYIVPLVAIVESVQPGCEQVKRIFGRGELIAVRGEYIPLLRLHERFGIATQVTAPSRGLVVIVENGGKKVGLLVDQLLGQQQVVIKSLEQNFKRMEGISGATILGNGRVALIVDVPGLVALARKSRAQEAA